MNAKAVKESLPYRLREQFLSSTEVALFSVLQEMADGRYIVCPKVALNDIFYIQRPNENVHFYNKIFRKHVDFLLCEPDSMKPVFGVELVTVNTAEGAAYGAALLAATGIGAFTSVEEACEATIKITGKTAPGEQRDVYQDLYPLYRDLYPALYSTFHGLH